MQQVQTAEEMVEVPAVGSPLGGGFFAGELSLDGDRYALVVAPKAAGEKFELEYTKKNLGDADGTDSEDDGLTNSDKINDKNHPAAQFCRSLQFSGYDDWYMPSRGELIRIWRALGPNKKETPELFRAGGAEAFDDRWYWSSTESASCSCPAWAVNFGDGYQDNTSKDLNAGVRAVRRFKV